MQLVLQRYAATTHHTLGKLFVEGVFFCYTLEDVVREQQGVPVEQWKIHSDTAIPSTQYAGAPYVIVLENSGRFGIDTPTLRKVPGFDYIRVHGGNTDKDTLGCLLLGDAVNASGIVGGTSKPAVLRFKTLMLEARARKEAVTITIRNIHELDS